jgi:hypothetical protein
VKIVKAGSKADDRWKVELYDEEIHTWKDLSDPCSYDAAVQEMKKVEEESNALCVEIEGEGASSDIKHRLRVRKVGSSDFVMNDVLC